MNKYLLFGLVFLLSIPFFGQDDLTAEEIERAIKICNTELAKNPNNEIHLMGRADAYMIKSEHSLALKDYITLSGINNSKEINYKIGRALLELKRYDSAIKNFGMAIKSDSLYFGAVLDRGIAYFSKGNYELALIDFFYISGKTEKYSYRVNLNLGTTYFYMDNLSESEKYLNLALGANQESYYVSLYLAGIMSKIGDYKRMCDYYSSSKENGLPKEFNDDNELLVSIKLKCK